MYDTNGNFELQVCPNGRASADEYLHQGSIFIEGREGSKYTLRFHNRTHRRVMVILSVDGLDVIKGQPAGPNSDGYLVDAQSSIEIPGWTLDNQTAAEFYFARIGKSYASASGANTNNVGVIGAMVFREKEIRYYPQPFYSNPYSIATSGWAGSDSGMLSASGITRSTSNRRVDQTNSGWNTVGMNSVKASSSVTQSVGTGFGDATQFNTSTVQFERAHPTVPDALMVMYYNTARNLQKMGIQIRTKSSRYDSSNAQAFPAYTNVNGCKPPPGWNP